VVFLKIIFKYFLFLFFIIFFASSVFAYTDFAINNINMPQTMSGNEDINAEIIILNNSPTSSNIFIKTIIYSPQGIELADKNQYVTVSPNSRTTVTETFLSVDDVNLTKSTQAYSLRTTILNDINGSSANNSFTKYFTVTKSSDKVPVPEMPVYFGFFVALLVALFAVSNNTKKKK
jgi:hypothetical protein